MKVKQALNPHFSKLHGQPATLHAKVIHKLLVGERNVEFIAAHPFCILATVQTDGFDRCPRFLRAILKNSPIVVLDEATAFTDPENEAVIQASIAGLVAGKTLIVIAHRLSIAAWMLGFLTVV